MFYECCEARICRASDPFNLNHQIVNNMNNLCQLALQALQEGAVLYAPLPDLHPRSKHDYRRAVKMISNIGTYATYYTDKDGIKRLHIQKIGVSVTSNGKDHCLKVIDRCVTTNRKYNGQAEPFHRLSASVFCLPPKTILETEVDHLDGNKFNNRCDNFEYVTPEENFRRRVEYGYRKTIQGKPNPHRVPYHYYAGKGMVFHKKGKTIIL